MRHLRSVVALCSSMLVLVGCGQSGALHLPKDSNQDKRAHYLIYPNQDPEAQRNAQQQSQSKAAEAAQ